MRLKKPLAVILLCGMMVPATTSAQALTTVEDFMLGDIVLSDDVHVTGDLYITSTLDLNGKTVLVDGNVYGNGALYVNGGKLTVKGDFSTVQSVFVDNGEITVNGNYYHRDKTLDLNNGRLQVDGSYRLQSVSTDDAGNTTYGTSNGTLRMDDGNDYFLVGGNFYFQSYWGNGTGDNVLTDGTLELKGNFNQLEGASYNFDARDNHKVIFSGSSLQTVTFKNKNNSGFNILAGTSDDSKVALYGRVKKIGADVRLNSFDQYGSLDVDGNTLTVAGTMIQRGNITVNGGEIDAGSNYSHRDGCLDLDNGTVKVAKNYRLQSVEKDKDGNIVYGQSYGTLKMNDKNDYMLVGGDFYTQSYWGNGTGDNVLTNGKLELKGSFTQLSGSSYNFDAKGAHRVLLSGTKEQTISFENPNNSGFHGFAATNKKINIKSARITKLLANSTVSDFNQYGSMNLNGKTLTVTGGLNERGSINVNAGHLKVDGMFNHIDGALDLNNGKVTVGGDYRLQSPSGTDEEGNQIYTTSYATVKMDDENDWFTVGGNFYTQSYWGNGTGDNVLTNGTLELKGDLTQLLGSSYNFDSRDNHKVIFTGDKLQRISFETPNNSGFNIISASTNTVVDIEAGRIRKVGSDVAVRNFNQYGPMDVNGNVISITENLNQYGSINVNGGELNVGGNYYHQDGCLDLNNGNVNVTGDYRLQTVTTNEDDSVAYSVSHATLRMDDENDYFLVGGSFYTQSYWGNGTGDNVLTNGTLELKGDFTQLEGSSYNFDARDNHKVIFSGDKLQKISFETPNNSGFNMLYATANTNVDITAGRIRTIGSNVTVRNYTQYGPLDVNGFTLTIKKNLVQNGNVSVNNGVLKVRGNYTHSDGILDLNGGRVDVTGDYRLQSPAGTDDEGNQLYTTSYATLRMDDPDDYFIVRGNFYTQSYWGNGTGDNVITNGTLELKGDFTQLGGSAYNFDAKDNHKVKFSGDKLQTISFETPNNSGFNILSATPNTQVDITAARIRTIGSNVEVKSFVQYDSLDVNGKTLNVSEDMEQYGNVSVNSGELNVGGSYYHCDRTLDLNNGSMSVAGDYRLQAFNGTDIEGNQLYTTSYATLRMDDPNDYMLVCGDFYTQSYWGNGTGDNVITNGILELKGDFTQIVGSAYNFDAKGNHRVIFSGNEKQTVFFNSPTTSGFNILYSTPNTNVDVNAARIKSLGSDVGVNTMTQYGNLDVNSYSFTVDGDFIQHGNVNVNHGIMNVSGNYSQREGVLELDNGHLEIGGSYSLQSVNVGSDGEVVYGQAYGTLRMDDPHDELFVGGDFLTRSYWGDGSGDNVYSDGILQIAGNFAQSGSSSSFAAYGEHITSFVGENPHIVTFSGENSHFNILAVNGYLFGDYLTWNGYRGYDERRVADIDNFLNASRLEEPTIVLGEQAVVRMSAFGGKAPYLYQAFYRHSGDENWIQLSAYIDTPTFSFTPDSAGSYYILIKAFDSNNKTAEKERLLYVAEPITNTSVISASEINLSEEVTVNAGARDGIGSYEFAVYGKAEGEADYRLINDFTSQTSIKFRPFTSGELKILVVAMDSKGHTSNKVFDLSVVNDMKNVSTISAESVPFGGTATVTCKNESGVAPFQYAVYYKPTTGTSWTNIQPYSENTNVTIAIAESGSYNIRVKLKDASGKTLNKDFIFTVELPPALENNTRISAESFKLGRSTEITCEAYGGIAPYQFAVYYKPVSSTKWINLQPYGENTSLAFTPDEIDEYNLRIKLKDSAGKIVNKDYTVKVTDAVMTNESTVSAETVMAGESVVVSCAADAGTAPYQYAVYYSAKGSNKWTNVQAYSENTTVTVTLPEVETYIVRVKLKDSTGKVVNKDFEVEAEDPELANKSTISAAKVQAGGSVTVSCNASGGETPYQFAVYTKEKSATKWTNVQAYSENTEVNVSFTDAGTYTVRVKAKDNTGKIVNKDFTVTVESVALTNKSTISKTTATAGGSVTVSCSASGGTAPYQYAVYYSVKGTNKWTNVQAYSENTEVNVSFTDAGTYTVRVKAKDNTGKIVNKDFTVTVESAALTNKSTISKTTATAGGSVTVSCSASGGTAPYQYAVYYSVKGTNKWTNVQAYSENTEVNVSFTDAGTYTVRVKAKDASGAVVNKDFTVTVEDAALTNKSTISKTTATAGGSVTVSCSASGGTAPYQYAVYYSVKGTNKWTNVQAYSANTSTSVSFTDAGTYTVRVKAKDASGAVANKDFTVTVN